MNALAGTVDVVDASDPAHAVKVGGPSTPGANSVTVRGGLVAVAEKGDGPDTPWWPVLGGR